MINRLSIHSFHSTCLQMTNLISTSVPWSHFVYRAHLYKTIAKLNTHNNLISKLAGSLSDISSGTLLLYLWIRLPTMVQIQSYKPDWLWTITAPFLAVCIPQTQWLPVLANIPPPSLCWKSAVDKMLCEIDSHQDWPVCADVFCHPSYHVVL